MCRIFRYISKHRLEHKENAYVEVDGNMYDLSQCKKVAPFKEEIVISFE
jgi:hypothetical protein